MSVYIFIHVKRLGFNLVVMGSDWKGMGIGGCAHLDLRKAHSGCCVGN